MREKPETGTPQVVEAQVPGISIAAGLPFRLDAEELADFAADEHSSDILKERFYRASLKNLLSQSDNEDVAIGHTEGATRSEKNDIAHTLPHQRFIANDAIVDILLRFIIRALEQTGGCCEEQLLKNIVAQHCYEKFGQCFCFGQNFDNLIQFCLETHSSQGTHSFFSQPRFHQWKLEQYGKEFRKNIKIIDNTFIASQTHHGHTKEKKSVSGAKASNKPDSASAKKPAKPKKLDQMPSELQQQREILSRTSNTSADRSLTTTPLLQTPTGNNASGHESDERNLLLSTTILQSSQQKATISLKHLVLSQGKDTNEEALSKHKKTPEHQQHNEQKDATSFPFPNESAKTNANSTRMTHEMAEDKPASNNLELHKNKCVHSPSSATKPSENLSDSIIPIETITESGNTKSPSPNAETASVVESDKASVHSIPADSSSLQWKHTATIPGQNFIEHIYNSKVSKENATVANVNQNGKTEMLTIEKSDAKLPPNGNDAPKDVDIYAVYDNQFANDEKRKVTHLMDSLKDYILLLAQHGSGNHLKVLKSVIVRLNVLDIVVGCDVVADNEIEMKAADSSDQLPESGTENVSAGEGTQPCLIVFEDDGGVIEMEFDTDNESKEKSRGHLAKSKDSDYIYYDSTNGNSTSDEDADEFRYQKGTNSKETKKIDENKRRNRREARRTAMRRDAELNDIEKLLNASISGLSKRQRTKCNPISFEEVSQYIEERQDEFLKKYSNPAFKRSLKFIKDRMQKCHIQNFTKSMQGNLPKEKASPVEQKVENLQKTIQHQSQNEINEKRHFVYINEGDIKTQREGNEQQAKQISEKERLEKEKLEKERLEKERMEKERLENERIEREKLEKERLEKERMERLEKERLEKERLEKERMEKEKLEKERLEKEKLEKERLEKERLEKERLENERLEKERLEKEKLEKERLEKERLERERQEQEKLERERLEKEKLEKERLEKERLKKEKLEKEKQERERLEKERLEKERSEKERLKKEKHEKKRLTKERLKKERLEKEKMEKEKHELEKLEKERLERERLEREQQEKERLEKEQQKKEKLEKEQQEKEKSEKERLEKEKLEKERKKAEHLERKKLKKERKEKKRLKKEKKEKEKKEKEKKEKEKREKLKKEQAKKKRQEREKSRKERIANEERKKEKKEGEGENENDEKEKTVQKKAKHIGKEHLKREKRESEYPGKGKTQEEPQEKEIDESNKDLAVKCETPAQDQHDSKNVKPKKTEKEKSHEPAPTEESIHEDNHFSKAKLLEQTKAEKLTNVPRTGTKIARENSPITRSLIAIDADCDETQERKVADILTTLPESESTPKIESQKNVKKNWSTKERAKSPKDSERQENGMEHNNEQNTLVSNDKQRKIEIDELIEKFSWKSISEKRGINEKGKTTGKLQSKENVNDAKEIQDENDSLGSESLVPETKSGKKESDLATEANTKNNSSMKRNRESADGHETSQEIHAEVHNSNEKKKRRKESKKKAKDIHTMKESSNQKSSSSEKKHTQAENKIKRQGTQEESTEEKEERKKSTRQTDPKIVQEGIKHKNSEPANGKEGKKKEKKRPEENILKDKGSEDVKEKAKRKREDDSEEEKKAKKAKKLKRSDVVKKQSRGNDTTEIIHSATKSNKESKKKAEKPEKRSEVKEEQVFAWKDLAKSVSTIFRQQGFGAQSPIRQQNQKTTRTSEHKFGSTPSRLSANNAKSSKKFGYF